MGYSIKQFTEKGDEVVRWLQKEFGGIRTGRATPALLDLVRVETYGTKMTLSQVSNVTIEDPRTLRISVWDNQNIKSVEKGILDADLGVSAVLDSSGLRVIFPDLTSERRNQLLKLAKSKHEDARVSLRALRDEEIKLIEASEKNKMISEDERFSAKEELQKKVDFFNKCLTDSLLIKEKEIQQ